MPSEFGVWGTFALRGGVVVMLFFLFFFVFFTCWHMEYEFRVLVFESSCLTAWQPCHVVALLIANTPKNIGSAESLLPMHRAKKTARTSARQQQHMTRVHDAIAR